jgi:ParB family chromosome partitioning protein
MDEIMREIKKDEIKVTFTHDRLKKYFPGFVTPQDMEEVIMKLLEGWYRRKQEKTAQQ